MFMASVIVRCRRGAVVYLAVFLLTVTAAPHHHLNDLEDLFLDQRSDSGTIIQAIGPATAPGALTIRPARLIPDVPCPACFTRDFSCAPTAEFLFVANLGLLPLFPSPPDLARPALTLADAVSRAPPTSS
jgi:hypothetical protein